VSAPLAKQNDTNSDFDMDGVIVTRTRTPYSLFSTFEELNIKVTEEMFTSFTGIDPKCFQNLKTIFNLDQEVEDLIQRKRTIFIML
jgi:beta-phosphoglucomutase-like phosphatase (HAD superfamily)